MAREALSALGEEVPGLLRADRAHIWFSAEAPFDIDLVAHQEALRSALAMGPGGPRDAALSMALAEKGVLLEDEPYADWALRPREALELVRQRARLELARDRARGRGRSAPEAVIEAWEACLAHDPASEEAASVIDAGLLSPGPAPGGVGHLRALPRGTGVPGATGVSGVGTGRAGHHARQLPGPRPAGGGTPAPRRLGKEERRLVSVLFAELSGPVGTGRQVGPRGPAPGGR